MVATTCVLDAVCFLSPGLVGYVEFQRSYR
jgi:hypothetical protein